MKSRQAAVIFIFITVVLDMLAIGLIAPVLPKLVLSFLEQRYETRRQLERHFPDGFRGDAVFLLARDRRFV